MGRARKAILEGAFEEWVKAWFAVRFGVGKKEGGGGDGGGANCKEDNDEGGDGERGMTAQMKRERYPAWAVDALRSVGIDLLDGE